MPDQIRMILVVAALAMSATAATSAAATPGSETGPMTAAVTEFLSLLDPGQREAVRFSLESDERVHWSNLPASMEPPDGLMLADLTDQQRSAVYRLLAASLSSQGYHKAAGIIRSDTLLNEILSPRFANPQTDEERFMAALASGYDSGNYGVAVFGDPDSGTWGWQIDGHHLAANFTVVDDRVSFTPLFLGSNPMRIGSGPYAGWMPLPLEGQKGLDLLNALDEDQRAIAIIPGEKPADILSGPGRQDSLERYEGLKASRLSVAQMRLLMSLVREYVNNAGDAAAERLLDEIDDADWEEIRFSWRGPTDRDDVFYYRVHGPRLLIEYSRQDPNHEHTILRDPANDYAADWLGRHYTEVHPTMDEVLKSFRERYDLGE